MAAQQAPLFVEFSKQEYWIGLPFPTLSHLLDPGIEPTPLTSPALAGDFFTVTREAQVICKAQHKVKVQDPFPKSAEDFKMTV